MSGSLVAEIDALIAKVKACPTKAAPKPAPAAPAAPPQAPPAPQTQDDEKTSQPATEASAPPATADFLDVDSIQTKWKVKVASTLEALKAAWAEAELGPVDESDFQSYLGKVGLVQEIEEDDETVQLRWENLDEMWIPVSCLVKSDEPLSSPYFAFHILDKAERMLNATPALEATQVDGDYLDIESVTEGMKVQVTEKFKMLRKAWTKCELGNADDQTLVTYLLQVGKIAEVEEDDDTVQLSWENLDTMWIPAECLRAAPDAAMTSPIAVSCLDQPDDVRAEEEEDAAPAFRLREWTMEGDQYLTAETIKTKKGQNLYMVTLDAGYLGQAAAAAGIEGLECEKVSGYNCKVLKVDGKTAQVQFNNKKERAVPIIAMHKSNKKRRKKGSPDL